MELNEFIKNYIWLVPILPLLGAAINGVNAYLGNRFPKWLVHWIGCGVVFGSGVIAALNLNMMFGLEVNERHYTTLLWAWISLGSFTANIGFYIDQLTSVMIMMVTGVGLLIHIYSIGYMADDKGYSRFFSFLNLFMFAMLVLVMADNILLMFLGWEGVGLCSYLLIGFWFEHKPNAIAGMKAFVVNRIGDFAFLVGIMLLFASLGRYQVWTLDFSQIKDYAHLLGGISIGGIGVVTIITLCFFGGAIGKSAQIPLHVWLPDAMAGPTPVSALIHAATMVTAGVFMIGRLNFLFSMAPVTLTVVAIVGIVTAIFAASIGLVQNDIKKVLAYSTISQLGFMFAAMGVAAYTAGIFHLITHAFFKACLFLGSGSVIIAMHHEQDIRHMGGLRKYIPWTYFTFLISTIAIAGFPPFSGFFSKDEILWRAFSTPNEIIPWLPSAIWFTGLIAAGMTSFYMFRVVFKTFHGSLRVDKDHLPRLPLREWPVMYIPLVILGIGAIFKGFVGVPEALGGGNRFHHFLAPVFGGSDHGAQVGTLVASAGNSVKNLVTHQSHWVEYALMALSVSVATIGLLIAIIFYIKRPGTSDKLIARWKPIYLVLSHKYYIDEIYSATFVKGLLLWNSLMKVFDDKVVDGLVNLQGTIFRFWAWLIGMFDDKAVDGAVNLIGNTTIASGKKIKAVQTGRIQNYLYILLGGAILLILIKLL